MRLRMLKNILNTRYERTMELFEYTGLVGPYLHNFEVSRDNIIVQRQVPFMFDNSGLRIDTSTTPYINLFFGISHLYRKPENTC